MMHSSDAFIALPGEIRRILISAATIEELLEKLQAFKCFPDIKESILGKRKIDEDKRVFNVFVSFSNQ
ncbi:hypothetical protein V6N13_135242 [Hibiscus sabdariffa]|uniref:Uncharacterized protein n=1 Tax=Hibiscus sabdariffa TaxID=183260 RepID=A0ABR2R6W7_9ROSI